jgi:hypothetical protein
MESFSSDLVSTVREYREKAINNKEEMKIQELIQQREIKKIYTDFFNRFIEKDIKEKMIDTIKHSTYFPAVGCIIPYTIEDVEELTVTILRFNRKSIYKEDEIQPDDNLHTSCYVEDIINSTMFKDLFNNLLKDLSGDGPKISWSIREGSWSGYEDHDKDIIYVIVFLRVN